jgi:hypothetical protein
VILGIVRKHTPEETQPQVGLSDLGIGHSQLDSTEEHDPTADQQRPITRDSRHKECARNTGFEDIKQSEYRTELEFLQARFHHVTGRYGRDTQRKRQLAVNSLSRLLIRDNKLQLDGFRQLRANLSGDLTWQCCMPPPTQLETSAATPQAAPTPETDDRSRLAVAASAPAAPAPEADGRSLPAVASSAPAARRKEEIFLFNKPRRQVTPKMGCKVLGNCGCPCEGPSEDGKITKIKPRRLYAHLQQDIHYRCCCGKIFTGTTPPCGHKDTVQIAPRPLPEKACIFGCDFVGSMNHRARHEGRTHYLFCNVVKYAASLNLK